MLAVGRGVARADALILQGGGGTSDLLNTSQSKSRSH